MEQEKHKTFADRMRQAMTKRDLKQSDLIRIASQRHAHLGKSQVSQYLSGKVLPRPDSLKLLASLLEVSPEWLLNGEKPAAKDERAHERLETAQTIPSTSTPRESKPAMRTFKKSSKLYNVLYDDRGPVSD